ncbi:unnamed protein product [Vitrella brassicaformis CCMP3155]|uniref:Uncharacterized protein n=1 Tax=Vitrella brassicaformis (strain CCMP3155) TaxID=1169540 RepID=A0A0G4EKU4_VITBC|nr:unnamed protein product [Vitrella brassicaformis CCMP3155]|eukprot:CEL97125.1 unnamed protein product [Vitrella brassicaformis CCMP3155]
MFASSQSEYAVLLMWSTEEDEDRTEEVEDRAKENEERTYAHPGPDPYAPGASSMPPPPPHVLWLVERVTLLSYRQVYESNPVLAWEMLCNGEM